MERMLDEIDDDTDLDEIAFNSQDGAFSWLKTAMNLYGQCLTVHNWHNFCCMNYFVQTLYGKWIDHLYHCMDNTYQV